MRLMKLRRLLVLALIGMPLITIANCDRRTGVFEFFRDDDADFFVDDGHDHDGWHEDGFVYSDEFYYEDEYYYEDCFFCF